MAEERGYKGDRQSRNLGLRVSIRQTWLRGLDSPAQVCRSGSFLLARVRRQ